MRIKRCGPSVEHPAWRSMLFVRPLGRHEPLLQDPHLIQRHARHHMERAYHPHVSKQHGPPEVVTPVDDEPWGGKVENDAGERQEGCDYLPWLASQRQKEHVAGE